MSGSGTEVAHETQDMDTSGEISHDDMSDYMSQGPQYAAFRHRSASFSEFSASPSANHGGGDREVIVYSRAIIGPELDNCGPQDPVAREEFSQALAKTGYANKVAFPSMAV